MSKKGFQWLAAGVVALASAGTAMGAPPAKFDMGKFQFDSNCAVCHGRTGKGDGPFAGKVDTKAGADITTLSRRNGGVFPLSRVYEVIDGRQEIAYHGTREMPIWGRTYTARATPEYGDDVGEPEAFVRARILALTEYVYRLQAK